MNTPSNPRRAADRGPADRRLFVYGTLAPGQSNADRLAPLRGSWSPATIRGRRLEPGWRVDFDYPGLVLDAAGDEVEGQLFASDDLPAHWAALDAFEGENYRRVVADVRLASGEVVAANVYVCGDVTHAEISVDDFLRVELRVGRIVDARVSERARQPAYVLRVDFGDALGVKTSSARITDLYTPEDLVGRLVVGVVNLPARQVGPIRSECLVTGFHDASGAVALCVPDAPVPLGTKLL